MIAKRLRRILNNTRPSGARRRSIDSLTYSYFIDKVDTQCLCIPKLDSSDTLYSKFYEASQRKKIDDFQLILDKLSEIHRIFLSYGKEYISYEQTLNTLKQFLGDDIAGDLLSSETFYKHGLQSGPHKITGEILIKGLLSDISKLQLFFLFPEFSRKSDYISLSELNLALQTYITTNELCQEISESFVSVYVQASVCIMRYFFCTLTDGGFYFSDLLNNMLLNDFFDALTAEEIDYRNHFTVQKIHKLVEIFQMFDTDMDNHLDRIGLHQLWPDRSSIFLDRLFEVLATEKGIAFEHYVMIQLMRAHNDTKLAKHVIFRMLCLTNEDGFSYEDLSNFLRYSSSERVHTETGFTLNTVERKLMSMWDRFGGGFDYSTGEVAGIVKFTEFIKSPNFQETFFLLSEYQDNM
ncbi:hypothetical protein PCE1_001488 [Barthelona sp. PCE]